MLLLLAALGALVVGVLLLRLSQSRKSALGIPHGDVVYQDHESQRVSPPTLTSERLGLRGKPDCLIRNQDGIIPVELKNSARPPARGGVYPNHLIQVLAYIVLVRESYNEPVPYGLVLYGKEEARKVYPTAENMAWLESVVLDVRHARGATNIDRSHRQQSRCRGCGMKESCDQSLVSSGVNAKPSANLIVWPDEQYPHHCRARENHRPINCPQRPSCSR